MKRLGRVLGSLLAVALTVASLQALAAETQAQTGGREFNHMSTGFPLSGGHATAACETCHMGGVFKGTPRNCNGCHAVGGRVVATPKSNSHIVTDAPCEVCHFNTSTWLGARFNHGTARKGECTSCHNGRISTGKHAGHVPTTYSCDQCHRTSSWIPASWNHTDTASDCVTCHKAGGPGRNYSASHMSQAVMGQMGLNTCRTCHKNYYSFYGAFYDHSTAGPLCQSCHGPLTVTGGRTFTGVKAALTTGIQAVHTAIGTGALPAATCQSCHTSIASFAGARYNHAGVGTSCANCHAGAAPTYNGYLQLASSSIHAAATKVGIMPGVAGGCTSCHSPGNFSSWSGARYAHNDAAYLAAGSNCATCHAAGNAPIRPIPQNHLNAFNAGLVTVSTNCTACHTSTGTWAQMNHTALTAGGRPCKNCHDSGLNPGTYFAGMRQKSNGHKHYNNATQDCISCHLNTYSYWNEP